MTADHVVIRVRDDADGFYAHARGNVISDPMPRDDAERIVTTAMNGREWEIVTADHCGDGCPWAGCNGCRYQGGTDPTKPFARQAFPALARYDGTGHKSERPPAPTDDLSGHSSTDQSQKEGLPSW